MLRPTTPIYNPRKRVGSIEVGTSTAAVEPTMYSGGVTGVIVEGQFLRTPNVGELLICIWDRNDFGSAISVNGYTTVQTGYETSFNQRGLFWVQAKIATGTDDEPSVDGGNSEFWQYGSGIIDDASSFTAPANIDNATVTTPGSNPGSITIPAAAGGTRWLDIVQVGQPSGTTPGVLSVTSTNGITRGFVEGTDDRSYAIIERLSSAANTIEFEWTPAGKTITKLWGFVLEIGP